MLEPTKKTLSGAAGGLLLGAFLVGAAGCEDLLSVRDPDVVTPEQLQGPDAVPTAVAGMINDVREMLDDYVLYSGMLTDEFILAGTFPTRLEIDERRPNPDNVSINGDVYEPLHVSRATADDNIETFTNALDDPAFEGVIGEVRDGLALAKLFAGYDRIFFAELFCQSIFGGPEGESAPVLPADRMTEALGILSEAETAAQDAGMTSGDNNVLAAAKVAQARALAFLGRYQEAAGMVQDVPTGFVFPMNFSENTTGEYNEVWMVTWGDVAALRWTVGDGTDDSRHNEKYPYYDEWLSQNLIIPPDAHQREAFGSPNRPVSLQTFYGGPSEPSANGRAVSIPLASGWEARMIEAEAMLRNGAVQQAEDLVNSLLSDPSANPLARLNPSLLSAGTTGATFGAFDPVNFTDDGGFVPEDDLRDLARARAAGMWLSGQRQGLLRRFFRNDGINMYPTGADVGQSMSLPVTQQELENNPNISQACPEGATPGQG